MAEFIASDCMFTESGFNINYRDEYIQKNGVYNASAKKVGGVSGARDRSASIGFIESTIMQGGQPIVTYKINSKGGMSVYQISNTDNIVIAYITIYPMDSYNMEKIEVEAVDKTGKNIASKQFSSLGSYGVKDILEGLDWLVSKNYL